MLLNKGIQEFLIRHAHQATFGSTRAPDRGPINWVIQNGVPQELQMDTDLVSASSDRPAPDHAWVAIVAKPLKNCAAGFAFGIHTTHTNLEGHNKDGLLTHQLILWEFSFHSTHILLFQLRNKDNISSKQKTEFESLLPLFYFPSFSIIWLKCWKAKAFRNQ